MSSAAVKAGGVFVEIGADPRKFFSALNKVNKSLGNMGRSLVSGGGKLTAAGIGMAAPIAAAVRQGAAFESTLLNIRASTGATAAQIDQIKASSMAMSQALGVGPTEAAQGMLELLKAGMSLDTVLGGAGRTAMEFAKVGEMDVAQAAVVMSDAMNVFKVSSDVAANALSSAADASSTSIAQMSEAFSMSSAVAGLAGQSIEDLSATLAILANNGVKGSDAGTSVKTMLLRLMSPADDAVGALDQLGLSVASFRGADGQMKPMVDIIGTLTNAMGGLDQTAKDDLFRRIFGADAIRAASILATSGVDGFNGMRDAMKSALPVGEKYNMLMSGLAGSAGNVLAALQRMAIAVSDAVAPALANVVPFITGFIDGLTKLATDNKEAVAGFAKLAVAAVAVGSALTGLGISLQVTSFGFAGIGKAAAFALSPLTMLMGTVTGVGKSFTLAMPATTKLASTIGSSMLAASGSVTSFASTAGSSLAGFAASGIRSVVSYGNALQGVFASQFRIARFIGQSFGEAAVTAFSKTAMSIGVVKSAVNSIGKPLMSAGRGVLSLAAQIGQLAIPLASVAASSMSRFVSDIAGGLAFTYKSFVWWATGASARMAQYAASLAGATGKTIASTAAMSAAWLGSAARGVAAFVGSAVAGIGTYLGAAAMAVAGSVASAAAVAAAWLAPLAPVALLVSAVAGAGAAIYAFRGTISGAFSGLAGYVSEAGGAIAGGFSTAVSDGAVVLGDLATTATTTFNGIYEAVAAGDLSGAMDVLWAGLLAGWLRGVEALMSYVDPMTSMMQNTFTYLSATVLEIWDGMLNRMAAGWDAMESNVRKGWNFLNAAFQGADQTALNDVAIDREMRQRASAREKAASMDYAGAADSVAAGREAANAMRATDRRAATVAAEGALSSLVGGKSETRAKNSQVDDLLASIKGATSVDQLAGAGGLGDQFSTLRDLGRLTTDQETMLSDALDKAAEGLTGTSTAAGVQAGTEAGIGKTSVAGTFSSINLAGQFGGSSLAERTAKAAEETAKGVKDLVGQGGGKVAA